MSFLRKAKGKASDLGKRAKDTAKSTYDRVSGRDIRETVAEHSETVTQILVGLHSDLVSQTARLDNIDTRVQDDHRSLQIIRDALDATRAQEPQSEVPTVPPSVGTGLVSPEEHARVKLLAFAALGFSVVAVILALVR